MPILTVRMEVPDAKGLSFTEGSFSVDLSDGRTITVPLAWYPRLLHSNPEERNHWTLIGKGQGIHWENMDEDISVEGILAGRRSGESGPSLRRWLAARGIA